MTAMNIVNTINPHTNPPNVTGIAICDQSLWVMYLRTASVVCGATRNAIRHRMKRPAPTIASAMATALILSFMMKPPQSLVIRSAVIAVLGVPSKLPFAEQSLRALCTRAAINYTSIHLSHDLLRQIIRDKRTHYGVVGIRSAG